MEKVLKKLNKTYWSLSLSRSIKIFQNKLFTARQRQLIKVQKLRTINLDSSDQNSNEISHMSLKKPGDEIPESEDKLKTQESFCHFSGQITQRNRHKIPLYDKKNPARLWELEK